MQKQYSRPIWPLFGGCLIGLLLSISDVHAATYYVATNGNNANSGSQQSPWRTITYAESRVAAGDVVRVQAGTYNEQPTINVDGNASNWITFIGDGLPVCRGFYLDGADYIKIIGFEITHNSTSFNGAFQFNGTCSNIQVIDNYIHHVRGRAGGSGAVISGTGSSTPSYITIRGNTLYYLGYQPGVFSHANIAAIYSSLDTAHHWLIEYNDIRRTADFLNTYGEHHIIRNNYMADTQSSYWPGGGEYPHPDMMQIGSDGTAANTRNCVYEALFCMDDIDQHGHFALVQDTVNDGDANIMFRGCVAANFGSGGLGVYAADRIKGIHNTFYDLNSLTTGGAIYVQYGSPVPTGNMFVMNIIQNDGNGTDAINVSTGTATVSHNIGYQAGSEASYVSTSNPRFVNPASGTRNFRLQAGSPAINTGTTLITITSATGSGTTFNVNNGELLCDGKGITTGDVVQIGATTTRVVSISGNAVTVANSVTWTNGQGVYWNADTTPDIGAFPYGSSALTAATYTVSGTTYTVTTTGDTRGVWFYVNGIPTIWDSDAPYSATISNGAVTMKAYALYAQATPVVTATASVQARPVPPANPRIDPEQ